MAEIITLQAYLKDLNAMLEAESPTEVISHCRYILQQFPQNVDTYCVLGKALLQKGQHESLEQYFDESADIFRHVLGVYPNNYTAHLGLSEIHNHQGEFGRAIWHMERAYEQTPGNAVLQEALRELYGKRDGVDAAPSKIQLTRSALARQYINAQLYDQALIELRAALEQMPHRVDLQVLLAQTLWDSHHPVEAGEIAVQIIKKLPNCLPAHRILAQLWLNYERPTDAQPFLQRIEALDPYDVARIVKPDANVADPNTLSRLDYTLRAAAELSTQTPDWVQDLESLGETGGIFQPSEPMFPPEPARTVSPQRIDTEALFADQLASTSEPDWMGNADLPVDEPEVPDWFGETAGDQEASVQDQAGTDSISAEWLFDQPEETPVQMPAEPAVEAEIPEWFAEVVGADMSPEPEEIPADEVPWMSDNDLEMGAGDDLFPSLDSLVPPEPVDAELPERSPSGFTDLLHGIQDSPVSPGFTEEADLAVEPARPEWLAAFDDSDDDLAADVSGWLDSEQALDVPMPPSDIAPEPEIALAWPDLEDEEPVGRMEDAGAVPDELAWLAEPTEDAALEQDESLFADGRSEPTAVSWLEPDEVSEEVVAETAEAVDDDLDTAAPGDKVGKVAELSWLEPDEVSEEVIEDQFDSEFPSESAAEAVELSWLEPDEVSEEIIEDRFDSEFPSESAAEAVELSWLKPDEVSGEVVAEAAEVAEDQFDSEFPSESAAELLNFQEDDGMAEIASLLEEPQADSSESAVTPEDLKALREASMPPPDMDLDAFFAEVPAQDEQINFLAELAPKPETVVPEQEELPEWLTEPEFDFFAPASGEAEIQAAPTAESVQPADEADMPVEQITFAQDGVSDNWLDDLDEFDDSALIEVPASEDEVTPTAVDDLASPVSEADWLSSVEQAVHEQDDLLDMLAMVEKGPSESPEVAVSLPETAGMDWMQPQAREDDWLGTLAQPAADTGEDRLFPSVSAEDEEVVPVSDSDAIRTDEWLAAIPEPEIEPVTTGILEESLSFDALEREAFGTVDEQFEFPPVSEQDEILATVADLQFDIGEPVRDEMEIALFDESEDETPDWLAGIEPVAAEPPAQPVTGVRDEREFPVSFGEPDRDDLDLLPPEDTPDWMSAFTGEELLSEPEPVSEEFSLDFLNVGQEAIDVGTDELGEGEQPVGLPGLAEDSEVVPDWLMSITASEAEKLDDEFVSALEVSDGVIQDDETDLGDADSEWAELEELMSPGIDFGADELVFDAELLADLKAVAEDSEIPEQISGTIPDWLADRAPSMLEADQQPLVPEFPEVVEDAVPGYPEPVQPARFDDVDETEDTDLLELDSTLSWLAEDSEAVEVEDVTLGAQTEPQMPEIDLFDFEMPPERQESMTEVAQPNVLAHTREVESAETADEIETSAYSFDDVEPAWLRHTKSLDNDTPALSGIEPPVEPPEWLQNIFDDEE